MSISKLLDAAIRADELKKNSSLKAGYTIGDVTYENYLEKTVWQAFVADMQKEHPTAYTMYGKGGGSELDERKSGTHTYPPKMASFGSSSRMIYNAAKKNEQFLFEKKLHTTLGGTANLDGFLETNDAYVFVEAKCREPYNHAPARLEEKYRGIYKAIAVSNKTPLTCILPPRGTKGTVRFMLENTEIVHFDLKQMICHLLGIATAFLNDTFTQKDIRFVYFLFNPKLIALPKGEADIHTIYDATCAECNAIDFKILFEIITTFLQKETGLGKEKDVAAIVSGFSFELKDQNTFSV